MTNEILLPLSGVQFKRSGARFKVNEQEMQVTGKRPVDDAVKHAAVRTMTAAAGGANALNGHVEQGNNREDAGSPN